MGQILIIKTFMSGNTSNSCQARWGWFGVWQYLFVRKKPMNCLQKKSFKLGSDTDNFIEKAKELLTKQSLHKQRISLLASSWLHTQRL